ncbi:helicase SRCAP [Drosophila busckii]|uniref:helicase SRCAP n=1 Tax=Drosophila busckii TaxID=30019 RepID=UPI0014332860|nr:helicase SRCAP [Drosophila busckii]
MQLSNVKCRLLLLLAIGLSVGGTGAKPSEAIVENLWDGLGQAGREIFDGFVNASLAQGVTNDVFDKLNNSTDKFVSEFSKFGQDIATAISEGVTNALRNLGKLHRNIQQLESQVRREKNLLKRHALRQGLAALQTFSAVALELQSTLSNVTNQLANKVNSQVEQQLQELRQWAEQQLERVDEATDGEGHEQAKEILNTLLANFGEQLQHSLEEVLVRKSELEQKLLDAIVTNAETADRLIEEIKQCARITRSSQSCQDNIEELIELLREGPETFRKLLEQGKALIELGIENATTYAELLAQLIKDKFQCEKDLDNLIEGGSTTAASEDAEEEDSTAADGETETTADREADEQVEETTADSQDDEQDNTADADEEGDEQAEETTADSQDDEQGNTADADEEESTSPAADGDEEAEETTADSQDDEQESTADADEGEDEQDEESTSPADDEADGNNNNNTESSTEASSSLLEKLLNGFGNIGLDILEGFRNATENGAEAAKDFLDNLRNSKAEFVENLNALGQELANTLTKDLLQSLEKLTSGLTTSINELDAKIKGERFKRTPLDKSLSALIKLRGTALELSSKLTNLKSALATKIAEQVARKINDLQDWADQQLERVKQAAGDAAAAAAKRVLRKSLEIFVRRQQECVEELLLQKSLFEQEAIDAIIEIQEAAQGLIREIKLCLIPGRSNRRCVQGTERALEELRLAAAEFQDLLQQGREFVEQGLDNSKCFAALLIELAKQRFETQQQLDELVAAA